MTTLSDGLFAVGVNVSAGASTNPGANFELDADFDQALFGQPPPKSNKCKAANSTALPVDAKMWLSGYVRLSSVAQPGAISSSTSLASYLSPAIQTGPANLVQSGEMLLSIDFSPWGTHMGSNPELPDVFALTVAAGAITPLSSSPASPTVYVVSQQLYNYYTTSPVPSVAANTAITSACGATFSTTTPCYVTFLPQERTSFFRDWSAGLKFKNYYYNSNSNEFAFPGITTLTVGQNEYVTGGAMSGFVLDVRSIEPLPNTVAGSLAGSLYVFGSMDTVIRRNIENGGAPQFSLATASSSISASATDVAQITVAQPNRDRYQFGVELDLGKLIESWKGSNPNKTPSAANSGPSNP